MLRIVSLAEDILIEIQAERLRELLKWRQYLPHLVEAVRSVLGDNVEIYVTGSAVRGELTVDSDIDVLVVVSELPRTGLNRAKILDKIWKIMESKGVPWWYPFEIHLITRDELRFYRKEELVKVY